MPNLHTDIHGINLPDGTKYVVGGSEGDVVGSVTAPNGSDAGTTQTLANALKVTVNELLDVLKAKGLIASDE